MLNLGHAVGITTVEAYLAERRRKAEEVSCRSYRPGSMAEVDFFEVVAEIDVERKKAWKFLMRLMASGKDFAWICGQFSDEVSFLDGHKKAFAHLGGIPRRIAYDNLTAAVKKRVGAERALSGRFMALVSHYMFEPCFARPGEGHDKGGVEAAGSGSSTSHANPARREPGSDLPVADGRTRKAGGASDRTGAER